MNPNAPAFPHNGTRTDGVSSFPVSYTGLTIRAEFAKAAMQGILSNPNVNPLECGNLHICELSLFFGDALIAELNKSAQS